MKTKFYLSFITSLIFISATTLSAQFRSEVYVEIGAANFDNHEPQEGSERGPMAGIGVNFINDNPNSILVMSFSGGLTYSSYTFLRSARIAFNGPSVFQFIETDLTEFVATAGIGARVGKFSVQPYLGLSYALIGNFRGGTIGSGFGTTELDDFEASFSGESDDGVTIEERRPFNLRIGARLRYQLNDQVGLEAAVELVRSGDFQFVGPSSRAWASTERANLILRGLYRW